METAPKKPIKVTEFIEWCQRQPGGKYELVAGEIVAMSPERLAHVRMKALIWNVLKRSIESNDLPCEALADGATVRIDEITAYEPDALVHCTADLSPESIEVPAPIIVVEVLSPGTIGRDSGAKLEDYFRLPSVVHYLIFKTERPVAIHHHRQPNGSITTSIHPSGSIKLDPPGLSLDVDFVFGKMK